MNSKHKKILINIIKFLFVTLLLYFLVRKGFISMEAMGRAFKRTDLMTASTLLLFITSAMGVIRWQWLLRAHGLNLPLIRTLQLTYVGNFFNIALPGAVSGDFVKAWYVAEEVSGNKARAFGSILFDRVAGLSALVLVSTVALLLDIDVLYGTPLLSAIKVMLTIAAVIVIAFYTYLFTVQEHHDPLLKLFKIAEQKYSKLGAFTRIYEGMRHYHNHRWAVIKVLLISIVIHIMVGSCCILCARALGESQIPLLPVFVVVPLGLLVTAVPIMPAGVGTGHAAFAWLFQFLGTSRGADIFSLYALNQLLFGAIGGLVYLRFKSKPLLKPDTILQSE